jgi:predicted DNA-binding ribbon-helix-helix protein
MAGTEIRKHSVRLAGHRTSVSLEDAFWAELKRLAALDGCSLNELITEVDSMRSGNLSGALRVYVLERLKAS